MDTANWSAEFDPRQVLGRWELTYRLDAQRLTMEELRISRRDVREELRVEGMRERVVTIAWDSSLGWRGQVVIRPLELGHRLDAFWESARGELIRINAFVFELGLWDGSYTGWQPDDEDTPTETAEWTMLPDGSFRSRLLLKQKDDSLTDLETFSPPEGVAPAALE